MAKPHYAHLSRRESQIMDIVYRLGEASVADVHQRMPDQPPYNSVRVTLGILEKKGYVRHRQEGQRYLYAPVVSPEKAKRSALRHLLKTFCEGSSSRAILTLLDMSSTRLSKEELDEIAEWIEQARKEAE
jgi:BlaI family penicillinase repressor